MENAESLAAVHTHGIVTNEKTLVVFLHPKYTDKAKQRIEESICYFAFLN